LPKDSIQKQSFCYATVAKKLFLKHSHTQNSANFVVCDCGNRITEP
jgi:hypothetical protein